MIFIHLPKFSQLSPNFKDAVKNILEAAKKPTLFCHATKSLVPSSSLTAILHRGMLFREHDQLLKFLLLTFLVIQKSLLVSDANKVAKLKNVWLRISKFFANVWFQKISRLPPRRELEIPRGWGGQRCRKFQRGGGLDNKITFRGVNIISFSTRVRTLLLTDLVDQF